MGSVFAAADTNRESRQGICIRLNAEGLPDCVRMTGNPEATGLLPICRLHRSSVLRRSALNPKLPQMMVQMLIHQRRPFLRSQRPEKEVRMLRACPRPARCKAVNEFS